MSFLDRKLIIDGEEVILHADGNCPMIVKKLDIEGKMHFFELDTYKDDFGVRVHTKDEFDPHVQYSGVPGVM